MSPLSKAGHARAVPLEISEGFTPGSRALAHRATATVEPLQSAPSADLVRDLKIMPADRKQNLILFLPDQQRADTLACYGCVKVHAPNLNTLAYESVIFELAYV